MLIKAMGFYGLEVISRYSYKGMFIVTDIQNPSTEKTCGLGCCE
ncbi:MAG: hypothetical protein NUV74_18175 [Candidatus Brocadiaceae bacterium]|nr:hypothetical protein [Candidatus Brocadiaceae bacterium]